MLFTNKQAEISLSNTLIFCFRDPQQQCLTKDKRMRWFCQVENL